MKRLGIYVIYDFDGIIDEYIEKVLSGLRTYLSKLIVVCNFTEVKSGQSYIEKYADKVKYRENIGFDAGAYKEVLEEVYSSGEIDNFDEILLVNDSFYGPIDSFDSVFLRMDKTDCDYWGLTRYPGGTYEEKKISPHIQSYFICFRKDVINSKVFYDFWIDLEYPKTFIDAVFNFEFRLNRILEESGFVGKNYTDRKRAKLDIKSGENPYMKYPLELLRNFDVPIIKRKAFDFENDGFCDAIAAFSYVEKYRKFNTDLIRKHLIRTSQQPGSVPKFDLNALHNFYEQHSNIYIYGAGGWGKNLASYFAYKGWSFEKFIVSNKNGWEENIVQYDEANLNESDGIIIAVGKKKIIEDIYIMILKKHKPEHIFSPSYIR